MSKKIEMCKHCHTRPATLHTKYEGCCSLQCRDAYNETLLAEAVQALVSASEKVLNIWRFSHHPLDIMDHDDKLDALDTATKRVSELL